MGTFLAVELRANRVIMLVVRRKMGQAYEDLSGLRRCLSESPFDLRQRWRDAGRVQRIPRWVRDPSVIVLALAIIVVGLAFGLKPSTIAKGADELDNVHHYSLGGILRNLACTRGDGEACRALAIMYFWGPEEGTVMDRPRAAGLASKSCDAGDAYGCDFLGEMYEGGEGVARDPFRAAALYSREAGLYSKACDAGDASACTDLGGLYDDSYDNRPRQFAKDYPRAVALYSKACDAGNADGCSSLGSMYSLGRGVLEDDSRAAELFSKACYGGDASSCGMLADYYKEGLGVGRDIREATMLYNKACSMGDTPSCGEAEKLH